MPQVIVVGGGIAGVLIARRLKATLITGSQEVTFPPLLIDSLNSGTPCMKRSRYSRILIDKVESVDTKNRTVTLESGETLSYEVLVLATGARPAMRVKGAPTFAMPFYHHADLVEVKRQPVGQRVVIVGGGATGVELAGALSKRAKVTLLHSAPTLVPQFPKRVQQFAHDALERLGVTVRTGEHVQEVVQGEVIANSRYPYDRLLWTAGVEPNIPEGVAGDKAILVDQTLRVLGTENVFAAGDCAQSGTPLSAQAAQQEARHVVRNVRRLLKGKSLLPFKYNGKGLMLSVGDKAIINTPLGSIQGRLAEWLRRTYYRLQFARY